MFRPCSLALAGLAVLAGTLLPLNLCAAEAVHLAHPAPVQTAAENYAVSQAAVRPAAESAGERGDVAATTTVTATRESTVVAASGPAAAAREPAGPFVPFWVMSTYECPQSPVQLAAGCRYRWWHIDSCGRCVPVDESAFYAALRPRVPVCVTVHGSFVTPEALGQQAAQTAAWLQQAAPDQQPVFVFLMWPSGGITTLAPGHPLTAVLPGVDVSVLGQRAEFNGFYLARLLASFEADRPVSLIGHSHGCRVISSALHLLAGGTVQGYCSPYAGAGSSHMRAVFAAAAIDHDWLNPGRRYGAALHRVEALLNLRNRRDWILNLYPLRYPFAPPSLANAGFTSRDLQQLGVWGWKLAELDVSHLVAGRHTWPRYYSQPSIAAAIAPWVFFQTSATVSE